MVGLSVWARWAALDYTSIAVVLALGLLSVPVVLLLSPVLMGRHVERVTAADLARRGARRRRRARPGAALVTVVDAHAHVIVPGLGAEVRWDERGQVVELGGKAIRAAVREFVDLGRILEEQDRAGVDRVVLCPWVNLVGKETARQNEGLAAMVGARVFALGTVDLGRPEELVELMRDGRLLRGRGGRQRGRRLPRARSLRRLLGGGRGDRRARLRPSDHPRLRDRGAERLLPLEHGGEPARDDDHRGAHGHGGRAGAPSRPARPPGARRRRDPRAARAGSATRTASSRTRARASRSRRSTPSAASTSTRSPTTRRCCAPSIEFAGAERVLLGSDYPFDMGLERPAEPVRALGLDPEDEALILGGNALRLVQERA